MRTRVGKRLMLAAATFVLGSIHALSWSQGYPAGVDQALGAFYKSATPAPLAKQPRHRSRSMIAHWSELAVDASGLDHTPVPLGYARIFGEQLGPARSSRAMAIVHIAVFEAANAIDRRYVSYLGIPRAKPGTSMDAAVAQAAHDTLVAMFPSQRAAFDAELARELAQMHGNPRARGVALGKQIASAVLTLRAGDGSDHAELIVGSTYPTDDRPGSWRQDPVSRIPLALGALWSEVEPFTMTHASQFRVPSPPPLASAQYAAAFDEVKRLGGDGVVTPTERTDEQTEIGIFWAYDGTPSLCAPPRLYNQIAVQIAEQMGTKGVHLARLLALVNTALADAAIAAWESKYYYELWRPVTAIREADPGSGPSGAGDGNDATLGDPTFTPKGAPSSNLTGPYFTPPFPAYPSGHAVFGGALFETLRLFYGRDDIPFTFVSDEYNGVTLDRDGSVRPLRPRSFATFSVAEEENGQSRIYLGIHWSFDKTEGIAQGRSVARYVYATAFKPRL